MRRLLIIIASTRLNRAGLPVGRWFEQVARADGRFDVDLVDLAELDLPFLDEPNHPHLRQYTHDHTRAWSATVDAADVIVFVTPFACASPNECRSAGPTGTGASLTSSLRRSNAWNYPSFPRGRRRERSSDLAVAET